METWITTINLLIVMVVLHISWAEYLAPTNSSQYILHPANHYSNTIVYEKDNIQAVKTDPPPNTVVYENDNIQAIQTDPPPNTIVYENDNIQAIQTDLPPNSSYIEMTSNPSTITYLQEQTMIDISLCSVSDSGYCRLASRCLPPSLHALEACALCYAYMPARSFYTQLSLHPVTVGHNQQNFTISYLDNGTHKFEANSEPPAAEVVASFRHGVDKWTACCVAARNCCSSMTHMHSSTASGWCPRTWDGWQCWPDTPNNTLAQQACPSYIYHFSQPPACAHRAERQCQSHAQWTQRTDYSPCSTIDHLQERMRVRMIAHSISIVALIPALIILYCYSQLGAARVTLHRNLFLSLLLHSLVVCVGDTIMTNEDTLGLIRTNSPWCVTVLLLQWYLLMTRYMWMLCEAYFLHKLVATSFAEQKSLLVYYLIGWVLPVPSVAVYAILRYTTANGGCWVEPAHEYEWIFFGPCLLSLMLNFAFLINIVRILVSKLRAQHNEPYRKAVRAAMLLVPLFGLQLLLTLYRPSVVACAWAEYYHYLNSCAEGLQGLAVSVAFCYLNGEVRQLIERSYIRWKEQRALKKGRRPSEPNCKRILNTTVC